MNKLAIMTEHGIGATMIEDSTNEDGDRLMTFELVYHRYIHGEFMTHRVFSRNASSSRAIPVKRTLAQVWNNPAIPVKWAANIKGMQAGAELSGVRRWFCRQVWLLASKVACGFASLLMWGGLHKQWANRLLEPWQFIKVVVTATEWDNFFELRDHEDAQPEIAVLARAMRELVNTSHPVVLKPGQWHLPYVTREERSRHELAILRKMSAARCARTSYWGHDGKVTTVFEDTSLFDRLVKSKPRHASPVEHQATPMHKRELNSSLCGNLKGWVQFRKLVELGTV